MRYVIVLLVFMLAQVTAKSQLVVLTSSQANVGGMLKIFVDSSVSHRSHMADVYLTSGGRSYLLSAQRADGDYYECLVQDVPLSEYIVTFVQGENIRDRRSASQKLSVVSRNESSITAESSKEDVSVYYDSNSQNIVASSTIGLIHRISFADLCGRIINAVDYSGIHRVHISTSGMPNGAILVTVGTESSSTSSMVLLYR